MNKRYPTLVLIFVICGIAGVVFASARLPKANKKARIQDQQKPKTLRERARERDVEVEGADGHLADIDLGSLKSESHAIVYGRILNSRSFFEESPFEIESGENITTEYEFQVIRVLKDTTTEVIPPAPKPAPALLTSLLRIARNGGVVSVNGHRASVRIKGFDAIEAGKSYVMFLNWSPDYRAYVPTAGIFGVVAVNDDRSLRTLSSSNSLQAHFNTLNLETFLSALVIGSLSSSHGTSYDEDWKYIGATREKVELYYSPGRVSKHGRLIRAWFKAVHPDTDKNISRTISLHEFNCDEGEYRLLQGALYYRNGRVSNSNQTSAWEHPLPESGAEMELRQVCAPPPSRKPSWLSARRLTSN